MTVQPSRAAVSSSGALLGLLILALSGCATGTKYQLVQNHPQQALLLQLTRRVQAVTPLHDKPLRVAIANLPAGTAGMAKGNTIYLDANKMAGMSEPMKLALICHEIAHIDLKHRLKQGALSSVITGVFTAANVAVPGVGYANWLVNPAAIEAYGTSHEMEANRKVTEYLVALGYPRNTMLRYLQGVPRDGPKVRHHASVIEEIADLQRFIMQTEQRPPGKTHVVTQEAPRSEEMRAICPRCGTILNTTSMQGFAWMMCNGCYRNIDRESAEAAYQKRETPRELAEAQERILQMSEDVNKQMKVKDRRQRGLSWQ